MASEIHVPLQLLRRNKVAGVRHPMMAPTELKHSSLEQKLHYKAKHHRNNELRLSFCIDVSQSKSMRVDVTASPAYQTKLDSFSDVVG